MEKEEGDPFVGSVHCTFQTPHSKVNTYCYGITPPPPAIPEPMFYLMHCSNPMKKARTCPVCWLHFDNLSRCAGHISSRHPAATFPSAIHPISIDVIRQWGQLAETVYPGYLREVCLTRKALEVSSFKRLKNLSPDTIYSVHS
ncbi:hypothetical protein GCK72_015673 [Caenorhabditis remanei]|uniref:Uncharacterized protein n=1 Tax=Caenorhabditis remanei TaxID=31234 RepID=A0A6A5GY20_CAERE|nr:hypothetical protein GCK72_015673 [Caenorhabditis remanei]KAF1759212.1 hypothetical protein GCK72_015673 [Caenorhabditis remanei]